MKTLNFNLYNKSNLFFKYKIRLELLQAIYGDNATIEDIKKKNEFLRKEQERWKIIEYHEILKGCLLKH